MPCGAQIRGDQLYCVACRLQWDIADKNPPDCRRGGEGRDAQLSPGEKRALRKLSAYGWFNRRGAKYRAKHPPATITTVEAATLVGLKLAFFSAGGGLHITTYGETWLARHTRK